MNPRLRHLAGAACTALFFAIPAAQAQPFTWTNVAPLGLEAWQENMQAMTYGNGLFIAAGWSAGVSGTSRRIALTNDLATWSYASFPDSIAAGFMPRRAGFGDGLYAIGGIGNPTSNTNKLVTSPDGLNWTVRDVKLGHVYGLSHVNGLWIATGDSGNSSSSLATSPDGVTWTARTTDSGDDLHSAAYGAGLYVAVGRGSQVVTSADGETWQRRTLTQSDVVLNDVIFAEGKFVACADSGNIYVSTDGLVWTEHTTAGKPLNGLAHDGETFVAVGDLIVLSSPDGVTWTTDTTNVRPLRQVVYGAGAFAAGGELATVYRNAAPVVLGPTIDGQPQSVSAVSGGAATFSVRAFGTGTLRYQWRFNGEAIVGATSDTLQLSGTAVVAGSYSVVVTDDDGSRTSDVATLTLVSATDRGRLSNLSVRTLAGVGDSTLVVGFAVGGSGTSGNTGLLLRGVGPTLTRFEVGGVLADPVVKVFQGTEQLEENDNWLGGFNFVEVGAFDFDGEAPLDAAIYKPDVPSGSYSVHVVGKGGATGIALAEVYDTTPVGAFAATSPRLVNLSARAPAGAGDNTLITGFVVAGSTSVQVLIRGVGPTLSGFDVDGVLADPRLTVFDRDAAEVGANDNWAGAAELQAAFTAVGAFELDSGDSLDAAMLLTLNPGEYTVHASGGAGDTGIVLVEVYELP